MKLEINRTSKRNYMSNRGNQEVIINSKKSRGKEKKHKLLILSKDMIRKK